jgi:hypothetical protein
MFCSICADDGVVVVDDSFLRTNRAASRLTKQGASARDWACIDGRSGILAEFCRRSSDRFDSGQREFCHSGARIGATLLASFPGSQMNTLSRIFVSALSPFITLLVLTASSTASAQDARGTVMNESLQVYSEMSANSEGVATLAHGTVVRINLSVTNSEGSWCSVSSTDASAIATTCSVHFLGLNKEDTARHFPP